MLNKAAMVILTYDFLQLVGEFTCSSPFAYTCNVG